MEEQDKPIIICAIAKNEHKYINDWVKYHLKLGFDFIYIGDNDDLDAPRIENFIDQTYRKSVKVINLRGKKSQWFQQDFYNAFYQKNKDNFSWCAFIDIDEFIKLENWDNIKDFVNDPKFDNYKIIRLKWHLYGDDDCIERDLSVPVYEFFTKQLDIDTVAERGKKIINQGKHIIRGGLDNILVQNHTSLIDGIIKEACTPNGLECKGKNDALDINGQYTDEAYLNHYMTKTLQEFLEQKYKRGDAMFKNRSIDISYFWRINKQTPEKFKYEEEWLNKRWQKTRQL